MPNNLEIAKRLLDTWPACGIRPDFIGVLSSLIAHHANGPLDDAGLADAIAAAAIKYPARFLTESEIAHLALSGAKPPRPRQISKPKPGPQKLLNRKQRKFWDSHNTTESKT